MQRRIPEITGFIDLSTGRDQNLHVINLALFRRDMKQRAVESPVLIGAGDPHTQEFRMSAVFLQDGRKLFSR